MFQYVCFFCASFIAYNPELKESIRDVKQTRFGACDWCGLQRVCSGFEGDIKPGEEWIRSMLDLSRERMARLVRHQYFMMPSVERCIYTLNRLCDHDQWLTQSDTVDS